MEIAYKNGTAFREIPMKEEYDFFLAVEYANKIVRQIKEWCFF